MTMTMTIEQAAKMRKLEKIAAFVNEHVGITGIVEGDKIAITSQWSNSSNGTSGESVEYVDTFRDAKLVLGY